MTRFPNRRAVILGLPSIAGVLLQPGAARAQSARPRPDTSLPVCGAPAGSAAASAISVFIYGITKTGDLIWRRHDRADRGDGADIHGAWLGGNVVGVGWPATTTVFGGGGGTIYAIDPQGNLRWYRHNRYADGCHFDVPNAWAPNGGTVVATGFGGFEHAFSPGGGIIYTISRNGILSWYRHNAFQTGEGGTAAGAWDGPRVVNQYWQGLKHVFAGGAGVIYSIGADGVLRWNRHNAFATGIGTETPGAWAEATSLAEGWGDVRQVFSPGRGLIYAVAPDGTLEWFRHDGFLTGAKADAPGAWLGPKDVNRGWNAYATVFPLMPLRG